MAGLPLPEEGDEISAAVFRQIIRMSHWPSRHIPYPPVIPFELKATLYSLSTADAVIKLNDCTDGSEITVNDLIDVMYGQADPVTGSPRVSAEAGTCGWAQLAQKPTPGAEKLEYDIVAIGGVCCEGSSSGSESSQSSDSSDSSQSSNSSGSSNSNPSSSGESKSTAIVPASWSKGGYAKLFIVEAPDVRFEDLFIVTVTQPKTVYVIDPKFYEVIEQDTLEVFGPCPNVPALVGASVSGGELTVLCPTASEETPVRIVMQCTAQRRGFKGVRFPDATKAEFNANEAWLRRGAVKP